MFSPRRFGCQQAGAVKPQSMLFLLFSFRLVGLVGDTLESSEVSGSRFGFLLSGALEDLASPLHSFLLRHLPVLLEITFGKGTGPSPNSKSGRSYYIQMFPRYRMPLEKLLSIHSSISLPTGGNRARVSSSETQM